MARKAFPSSTNMETTLRRKKKRDAKIDIIAKVFPVNHLTFKTPESRYIGPLMSALEKLDNARLAMRMFAKVRSFLNRARIPRTNPLPSTEKMVSNDSITSVKIVMEEKSSTSMIFLAHLSLSVHGAVLRYVSKSSSNADVVPCTADVFPSSRMEDLYHFSYLYRNPHNQNVYIYIQRALKFLEC